MTLCNTFITMYYMTYNTILTSKGTTTIPVEIRKQLGIEPGMHLAFTQDEQTGEVTIKRTQTIEELRALNKAALEKAGTLGKEYQSGDGFNTHVDATYGEPT